MNYLLAIAAFFICLGMTPLVRRVAHRRGWIAVPRKDRWHDRSTALLGGIAIYTAIGLPLLWVADFGSLLPHLTHVSTKPGLPSLDAVVWIGATLMFVLGLLDDFIGIKPHTKLVGQILVAALVTFLGFRLRWFTSLTVDTMVTIVWIVGMTNAFNLIDNMDGLCAGIGMVAALVMSFLLMGHHPQEALIALITCAALGAFLFYNFNPASIFMGDCGSLVIGYTLAMLCMYYPQAAADNLVSAVSVPVMVLMVPILDTTLVTMIRLLSGRKASTGGKDHTSHRLVLMGLSERGAVLFLYGIGTVSGIAAIFVNYNDTLTSPAVIIPMALALLLMGIYLAQLRVYPEKEFSLLRGQTFTPILIELTYKRHLTLVIFDFGLIAFAYYLSYRLRFDSQEFLYYFKIFLRSLPAVIACKFIAFFALGIYRGIWGYMSTNDVFVYLKASTFATILSVTTVTFIYRFEDFSKGIFVIDWLLTTAFLLGTRGSFRMFIDTIKRKTLRGDTVFIYGAGRGGEILLRELLNNKRLKIKPVAFLDDDFLKTGKKLQGFPILGPGSEIETHLKTLPVCGVLVSFDHHDPERLQTVKNLCRRRGLFLRQFSIHLEEVDLEE